PSAAWSCLINFSASPGLVRSAGIGSILRPVALAISAAVSSSGPFCRPQIATSTPSRANDHVTALPMPALPPVTTAFLPVIARSMASLPKSSLKSPRGEPRHQLERIAVQDFRHVRVGKAGLADRGDRIEIGRRKRVIAAEHDA